MTIKDKIAKHKNIIVILLVMLTAIIVYRIDLSLNEKLSEFVSSFAISKILAIFFLIGGFVSLFFPFSFRKEISKSDISNISKKTIEATENENRINKRLEDQATF
jgi:hypothetical protein